MGHQHSLAYEPWPSYDPQKTLEEQIEIVLQVNGKVRGKLLIPQGADQANVEQLARLDANVQRHLEGKQVKRVIVVPNKIVNIVIG